MTENFHYKKYLKYKQKYIQQKLIGGDPSDLDKDFISKLQKYFHTNLKPIDNNNIVTTINKDTTETEIKDLIAEIDISNNEINNEINNTEHSVFLQNIYRLLYYILLDDGVLKYSIRPFITNNTYKAFYEYLKNFYESDNTNKNIIKSIIDHFKFVDKSSVKKDNTRYGTKDFEICFFPNRFREYMWHLSNDEFEIKQKLQNIINKQYELMGKVKQNNIDLNNNFYTISNNIYNILPTEIQTFYKKCSFRSCWNYTSDTYSGCGRDRYGVYTHDINGTFAEYESDYYYSNETIKYNDKKSFKNRHN